MRQKFAYLINMQFFFLLFNFTFEIYRTSFSNRFNIFFLNISFKLRSNNNNKKKKKKTKKWNNDNNNNNRLCNFMN